MDFRTPRFDLDNLYGRGPDDQPYMYKKDGIRMLLGERMSGDPFDPGAVQLPRGPSGRALIGDPRNDENRIVAQLHAIFLRFHNRVVHKLRREEARQLPGSPRPSPMALPVDPGQRLPAHDSRQADIQECLPGSLQALSRRYPRLRENDLELMPVEFSVAAYRFGHSMIRPQYKLNPDIERPIFPPTRRRR